MARLNVAAKNQNVTHEGAPATPALSPEKQLRRSVMACLLWEDQFYEDGQSIADRISETANKVSAADLALIAIEAREVMNLRHVPLLLAEALSARKDFPAASRANTMARIIQRPDEMAELLAIYWRKGRKMVPHAMQKALQKAFGKFDEYQLAKYDRAGAIKLRDVLRLARPKPVSEEQSALFKRVKDRALVTPDTWEVELSAGKAKKETFTRLLEEKKLGYLALLRNLRNMEQANVDPGLVRQAILARKGGAQRVLPFRYVAAARAAPIFEAALDKALCAAIEELPVLKGTTLVLVDCSGSMHDKLSARSDMTREDAACALASIINGDVRVFAFSNECQEVPPRRGMAGVDAIKKIGSRLGGGTELGKAIGKISKVPHDRLIVITDEQSWDRVPDPVWCKRAYMINVAAYKNGVGYGPWTHLDGFSEGVLRYIHASEEG